MKTVLIFIAILSFSLSVKAQSITDTVSLGSGYANQVWYSLQNDELANAPKNNWDLAFDASGFGSSIYINSITGTQLWIYPNGDTSSYATLDTAGLSTWTPLYNSDTSWKFGAFDATINTSNPYDLGWGVYNPVNHYSIGDSLYVIKLSDNSYRKLWIKRLTSGTYEFRFANIDGTNDLNSSLVKSNFSHKNFGYYSLQNNAALDREPVDTLWDLLFTQYTSFVPQAYTVTGVLSNKGVSVAQADNIADVNIYNDWSTHTYSSLINEIGYDWKSFNGTGFEIADSLLYFIKTKTNDIWKIVFTGYGGSANGNIIFTKEKLSATGMNDLAGNKKPVLLLYPNPCNQSGANLIYTNEENYSQIKFSIFDISGKEIRHELINASIGFHQHHFSTQDLKAGIYFIRLETGTNVLQQKLVVY